MSRIKPLYDGIRLNCTVVSDTHIDIKHPMPWLPKWRLNQTLKESQNSKAPVDAYITVGDTTSRGSTENWELTKGCFAKFKPAKKILLCIGNHDGWNDDNFDAAVKNFYKYTEEITGKKLSAPYFSEVVSGYHFIFIGTDSDAGCEAQISDEQMEWFKAEMEQASQSLKPIFVFCHQSLNQKHGLPRTWDREEDPNRAPEEGGIGARSAEVESILKSYKNVFYFSGHSHMGFCGEDMLKKEGYSSFENDEGLELINMPSLACGNHHGEIREMAMGLQLEAYDDKVVLRPRSYKKHRWLRFNVRNGKNYLEVSLN